MTSSQTLPVSLDPQSYSRLAVVKEVYDTAMSQSVVDSPSARMLAVINFDFCVETLLKLVFTTLRPNETVPWDFRDLVPKVHDAIHNASGPRVPQGVPQQGQIRRTHEIRNNVQHHADYPTPDQVDKIRLSTTLFTTETAQTVWNQDFESIDLLDAVNTSDVKRILAQAKAELAQPDPKTENVVAYCWRGLRRILGLAKPMIVGYSPETDRRVLITDSFSNTYEDRGLLQAISLTQDIALILALGMDASKYLQYNAMIGTMSEIMGRGVNCSGGKDTITLEVARWVYSYCVESVRQIESRLGALHEPDIASWASGITSRMIDIGPPEFS